MTVRAIPDCTVLATAPHPQNPNHTQYEVISSQGFINKEAFADTVIGTLKSQSGLSKTDAKILTSFFLTTTELVEKWPHAPIPPRVGGQLSKGHFYGNTREFNEQSSQELDTLRYTLSKDPSKTYTVRIEGDRRALNKFSDKSLLPAPAQDSAKKVYHAAIWSRINHDQKTFFTSTEANETDDVMLKTFFNTEGVETVSFGWHGLSGANYFKYGKVDESVKTAKEQEIPPASSYKTPKGDSFLHYFGKKD